MSLCGEIENLEYETSYLEHEIKELHKATPTRRVD